MTITSTKSTAVFTVILVICFVGWHFLRQRFNLDLTLFSYQKNQRKQLVNCSEFGFANAPSRNVYIYDFFILNDELDILEIRLFELYDYVTIFLIAESNLTFSGKPKPFHLKDNWARFAPYHNKIRRVELTLMDLTNENITAWDNEKRMRDEGIRLALPKSTEDFLLMTSDVDEIPKSRFVRALASCQLPQPFPPIVLECDFYYYSFEFHHAIHPVWYGGTVSQFSPNDTVSSDLRAARSGYRRMPSACFHCSYCLDRLASVRLKISSFSHTELDIPKYRDQKHIMDRFQHGKDLFDRVSEPLQRTDIKKTELPRLLEAERERFMYMLNRSSLPNVGFRDA